MMFFTSGIFFLVIFFSQTKADFIELYDENTFLAYIENPSLESFETLSATNYIGAATDLELTDFTISTTGTSFGVFNTTPFWGGHATEGNNFISYQSDTYEELLFTFDKKISAFGLNITDWGDEGFGGFLIFRDDLGNEKTVKMSPQLNDNEFFYGVVNEDFDFNQVVFVNSIPGEAYSFDEIYYTSVSVPEPQTACLIWLGIPVILLVGIVRRKLPCPEVQSCAA